MKQSCHHPTESVTNSVTKEDVSLDEIINFCLWFPAWRDVFVDTEFYFPTSFNITIYNLLFFLFPANTSKSHVGASDCHLKWLKSLVGFRSMFPVHSWVISWFWERYWCCSVSFCVFSDDSPVAWTSVIWQKMRLAQFDRLVIACNDCYFRHINHTDMDNKLLWIMFVAFCTSDSLKKRTA